MDVTNNPELKNLAIEEGKILSILKHPYIMNYYGYFEKKKTFGGKVKENVTIISDYYSNGTMLDNLHNNGLNPPFEIRLKWAIQIAYALDYLHSLNITHRDLKPDNILISENYDAILADFGYAKKLMTHLNFKKHSTVAGTILWIAPEIFLGLPYDNSVDIFSFGILLYEILSLKWPYKREDYQNEKLFEQKVIGRIMKQNGTYEVIEPLRPDIGSVSKSDFNNSENYSLYLNLMKRCWNSDPKKRPNWNEIIKIILT